MKARAGTPTPRRCPVCGKPAGAETQPFCSERCAEVDLHRWLAGAYAIPGQDEAETPPDPEADTDGN